MKELNQKLIPYGLAGTCIFQALTKRVFDFRAFNGINFCFKSWLLRCTTFWRARADLAPLGLQLFCGIEMLVHSGCHGDLRSPCGFGNDRWWTNFGDVATFFHCSRIGDDPNGTT